MSQTKLSKQNERRRVVRNESKQLARAFFVLQYAPIAVAIITWAMVALELKWI